MTEIVNPDVLKPGAVGDGLPWFLKVGSGFFVLGAGRRARNDIEANARQQIEDRQRWRFQDDGFLPGLAGGVAVLRPSGCTVDAGALASYAASGGAVGMPARMGGPA